MEDKTMDIRATIRATEITSRNAQDYINTALKIVSSMTDSSLLTYRIALQTVLNEAYETLYFMEIYDIASLLKSHGMNSLNEILKEEENSLPPHTDADCPPEEPDPYYYDDLEYQEP